MDTVSHVFGTKNILLFSLGFFEFLICICFFYIYFADPELLGVGSLLKKYIALLCTHIGDILPVATSIASTGCRHFAEVSRVIEGDLTGNCTVHTNFRNIL